jgi:hypothetical protein
MMMARAAASPHPARSPNWSLLLFYLAGYSIAGNRAFSAKGKIGRHARKPCAVFLGL